MMSNQRSLLTETPGVLEYRKGGGGGKVIVDMDFSELSLLGSCNSYVSSIL